MSRKTYEIRPGQQYDPEGATIVQGSLRGKIKADGSYDSGQIGYNLPEEVEAAVERVLETREPETVVVGEEPETVDVDLHDHGPGWCDRCESYCYGDCTAY